MSNKLFRPSFHRFSRVFQNQNQSDSKPPNKTIKTPISLLKNNNKWNCVLLIARKCNRNWKPTIFFFHRIFFLIAKTVIFGFIENILRSYQFLSETKIRNHFVDKLKIQDKKEKTKRIDARSTAWNNVEIKFNSR